MEIKRTKIVDIFNPALIGTDVCVKGWVRTRRGNKQVQFIALNDGSTIKNVQIVVDPTTIEESLLKDITTGACLCAIGKLVESQGAGQSVEIQCQSIELYGTCPNDYPMQKKGQSFEYMRKHAHMRLRTNTFGAVFRIRHHMAMAVHRYFSDHGFFYFHSPIITASDCEGAGEMFQVTTKNLYKLEKDDNGSIKYDDDFFGKMTSLTVSGQLEGELGATALGAIYTFGPTFRAENSNTPRHLAEFWMIEPEIAFADLEDEMQLSEDMIKYIFRYVLDNCPREMKFFNDFYDNGLIERLENICGASFARVDYTDAVAMLEKVKDRFEYPVYWGCDLQTEHERYLTEEVYKAPIFVTNYPKEIKAFYMRQNDDGKTVAAADLLVPGVGEIVGGSQREERLDVLLGRIRELGLKEEDYSWYLDLRRFGGCKHAGYGLGFERIIMYLTGIQNIRDVLPFPRTTGSAEF